MESADVICNETASIATNGQQDANLVYQETLKTLSEVESMRLVTTNVSVFEDQTSNISDTVGLLLCQSI